MKSLYRPPIRNAACVSKYTAEIHVRNLEEAIIHERSFLHSRTSNQTFSPSFRITGIHNYKKYSSELIEFQDDPIIPKQTCLRIQSN